MQCARWGASALLSLFPWELSRCSRAGGLLRAGRTEKGFFLQRAGAKVTTNKGLV